MKIERITYQRTYSLGSFINERVGCEIQLEEGDDVQETINQARAIADKNHTDNNPQLYGQTPNFNNINTVQSNIQEAIPALQINEPAILEDKEWNAVKDKLMSFETREDAQAYINTTPYKLTIEAKKIINSKKPKNEKSK